MSIHMKTYLYIHNAIKFNLNSTECHATDHDKCKMHKVNIAGEWAPLKIGFSIIIFLYHALIR